MLVTSFEVALFLSTITFRKSYKHQHEFNVYPGKLIAFLWTWSHVFQCMMIDVITMIEIADFITVCMHF